MRTRFQDRWLAVVVPLLFCVWDVALTLGNQPPDRTAENVDEYNPVAAQAMAGGPATMMLLGTVWVLVIVVPILLLPRFWAAGYCYTWVFGHAATSLFWLAYPEGYGFGFWSLVWYCPIVAVALTLVGNQMFRAPPENRRIGSLFEVREERHPEPAAAADGPSESTRTRPVRSARR